MDSEIKGKLHQEIARSDDTQQLSFSLYVKDTSSSTTAIIETR